MSTRYQVFISSTYVDLKEARRQVGQTIAEMDCIPAGMELFPAADEDQFEFIKGIIDDSDYYVLILAGRYGSLAPDGISYTEKEFDYATDKGIKVIALIHGSPDDLPARNTERDRDLREKLARFRDKVTAGRIVKFWTKTEELSGLVATSLQKSIAMFPATGWVRASAKPSENASDVIPAEALYSSQLSADLRDGSLYQDFNVSRSDGANENLNAVHFLWADTFAGGDIRAAVMDDLDRQHYLRVWFVNGYRDLGDGTLSQGWASNVKIAPQGRRAVNNADDSGRLKYRYLDLEVRSPGSDGESPTASKPVGVSFRILDRRCTYWEYRVVARGGEPSQFLVTDDWKRLSIDLVGGGYRMFGADGNRRWPHRSSAGVVCPDFSVVAGLTLVVGCYTGDREEPGRGSGVLDVREMRFR